MIGERGAHIVEAVVREFIETGEPVSSDWLYRRYRFGIKPAMIRAELVHLTDQGFLEQPHPAAGRIPTDRAYEFFARHVLHDNGAGERCDEALRERFDERDWPEFVERFSRNVGVWTALFELSHRLVYKDGLENLVDHLSWDSRAELKTVIRDFEAFDRRVRADAERLHDENDDAIRVFIGKKSPVTRSRCLAVMAGEYDVDGERVFLFAIGPKRMDYEKAARILRALQK